MMEQLPTGKEIINALSKFGKIEWCRNKTIVASEDDPFPRNYIHHPHFTAWRYKDSDPQLLLLIKEAVESFQGNVEWGMWIREDKPNCVIKSTKAHIYQKEGKLEHCEAAKRVKNPGWPTAEEYIAQYEPEWGRMANMDVQKLATHIDTYVHERMSNNLQNIDKSE
jgi:hypothetical protein